MHMYHIDHSGGAHSMGTSAKELEPQTTEARTDP